MNNTNSQEATYAAYVENLQSIEYSIKDTFNIAKNKISKKQQTTKHFNATIRLLILQLGIWSEARFFKLLNEYHPRSKQKLISVLELKLLALNKHKIEQWKTIIELAFRKHYQIYIGVELTANNLGDDKFSKYENLLNTVEKYLQSIIEVRNKLAHGLWIHQLKENGSIIQNQNLININNENIITLEKKYQILKYLTQIIHDLILSKATFERDFEKHYKEIQDRVKFIDKHSTQSYQKMIVKLQQPR